MGGAIVFIVCMWLIVQSGKEGTRIESFKDLGDNLKIGGKR